MILQDGATGGRRRPARCSRSDIASQGSARIGGVLSSNAGGVQVLAYGNARELCLGVEAVLADGRLYQGLNALRKDNTGYDLKDLLVGAEGTLGIITAATLKLFPKPEALRDGAGQRRRPRRWRWSCSTRCASGSAARLTAFELMPRFGIDLQLRHDMLERDPAAEPLALVLPDRGQPHARRRAGARCRRPRGGGRRRAGRRTRWWRESEADRALMWAAREQMSDVQSPRGRLDQARRLGADRRGAAADRRGLRGGGAAVAGHPPLPVRAHGRRQYPLQLQPAGRRRRPRPSWPAPGRSTTRSTRSSCGSAARSRPSTASASSRPSC